MGKIPPDIKIIFLFFRYIDSVNTLLRDIDRISSKKDLKEHEISNYISEYEVDHFLTIENHFMKSLKEYSNYESVQDW